MLNEYKLKKPFTYHPFGKGLILDANNTHVLDVRGWGHFQYLKDSEAKQDEFGEHVAKALNKYFEEMDK